MNNSIWILILVTLISCIQDKNSAGESDLNQQETYYYNIDITKYDNDQLPIEIELNGTYQDSSIFCLPKVIPGIYDEVNFGKLISEFKATDVDGNALEIKKLDINRWQINGSKELKYISYKISDGWENFDLTTDRPYRSSESSFNSDTFILSTPSIFGYIIGHEDTPFQIKIIKPANFYGATSLEKLILNDSVDILSAKNYRQLADNPILYAIPDTTNFSVSGIKVQVACKTESGEKISSEVADKIKPLIENQIAYFGTVLPAKHYTFLIYQNTNSSKNKKMYLSDGLEHSNSQLVLMYLPNNIELIINQVYHIVSHEFFHTIMPLGLHSFEIANFDFINPKFSKHLWLYEGTTEYFTIHMLIKNKLQSLEEFVHTLEQKIERSSAFDENLSLTDLSLDPIKYQDQYMNIYEKGALLNLCLDIRLRELTDGRYGVQDLIKDLVEKYGIDKPFDDNKLFSDIVELTDDKIVEFINDYIVEGSPLPLVKYLKKVGLILDSQTFKIKIQDNLTAEQLKLRDSWIDQ